jgi:hypothetical protein
MKTLHDQISELMNNNSMIYDENEFQIQLYMSKKWPEAFEACAVAEGEEYDESFPSPVPIVADLAASHISDPVKFVEDFQGIMRYLSKGGNLSNGVKC